MCKKLLLSNNFLNTFYFHFIEEIRIVKILFSFFQQFINGLYKLKIEFFKTDLQL